MKARRRVRHHVNPFREEYLATSPQRLALPAGPIEVELGCADARFLFERQDQERERAGPYAAETNYVGLEIRREMVERVNRRARGEGRDRLRAVFAHINYDLPVLFAPGSLSRVFINFPDPWFKRAQQKRRLCTRELALCLHDLLVPGGEIFFQSDIFDLALDAMAVLEATPGLWNAAPLGEWSFLRQNPYGVASLREVRVLDKGLPVWRMLYLKPPTAG